MVSMWYTRVEKFSNVQVIWKRLYSIKSAVDIGTLYQLRNEVRRTNIYSDPSKNVNASVDFLSVVMKAHIVAAAMDYFKAITRGH